jgi:hypothetical protein
MARFLRAYRLRWGSHETTDQSEKNRVDQVGANPNPKAGVPRTDCNHVSLPQRGRRCDISLR